MPIDVTSLYNRRADHRWERVCVGDILERVTWSRPDQVAITGWAGAFGEPRGSKASAEASYVPMFAHLSLVLVAGVYLPAPLVVWFQHVAGLLG